MHTFHAQPAKITEVDRQRTPCGDSPQLATSNQHRSGLSANEQVSLKLSVRLQRLPGRPWHPKTRPKLPKALQILSVKTTTSMRSSQAPSEAAAHGRAPKIEGGIQRPIQMPVCRAIRRLHILQTQLMTVSGRLSGDPSFLGLPTTRACRRNLGNSEVPRRSRSSQSKVLETKRVPIPSVKTWRTSRGAAINVTRPPRPIRES